MKEKIVKENYLSRVISQTDANSQYDEACKRILANKIILAWILKSCVEEFANFDVNDIAEYYIEGMPQISTVGVHPDETNQKVSDEVVIEMGNENTTLTEGTVKYDIQFWASVPNSGEIIRLLINIEAHGKFYPGYPIVKRGVYYTGRMLSAQYGTEFTDSHYEKIKKVYSIWICLDVPKYRRNTINCYEMKERHIIGKVVEEKQNYDLLSVIMVGLGTEKDENFEGILKLLGTLLSNNISSKEKKEVLQDTFKIDMTTQMEREVSEMCNLSDYVMKQGIEQGKENANLTSIRNLMDTLSLTAEQAMNALKIPDADKQKYLKMLL